VASNAGSVHQGTAVENNYVGYMKASPDGKKLAIAISGSRKIELFNFNNMTGGITFAASYVVADPEMYTYGVEFSPDSKLLYVTVMQKPTPGAPSLPSSLIQFDLATGLSDPFVVAVVPDVRLAGLQLAIDGRIYVSVAIDNRTQNFKDYVDVIYNPSRKGLACNYASLNGSPATFLLDGRKNVFGLPNMVQSFVDIPLFTFERVCHGDGTRFSVTNDANTSTVNWDFGDGTPPSTEWDPVHQYATPGTYSVTLTETFNGESFPTVIPVTIFPLPDPGLPDKVLMFTGSSVNLKAREGYAEYLWSTGSTEPTINVATQGTYTVTITDSQCCVNTDETIVQVFDYYIPNAFSPNGDNLNDIFRVVGLYKDVTFSMFVYNRWGQMVFESNNIEDGWNGMYKNEYCPPDSYVWVVKIAFNGDEIITQGDVTYKGTVTVIR
jgi:gliding motility-associated-like protein